MVVNLSCTAQTALDVLIGGQHVLHQTLLAAAVPTAGGRAVTSHDTPRMARSQGRTARDPAQPPAAVLITEQQGPVVLRRSPKNTALHQPELQHHPSHLLELR